MWGMNHVRLKLVVGGIAIALAVALLATAGIREGLVYYLPVDEFLAGDHQLRRVRLHGTVSEENYESDSAGLHARFDLLGDERRLRVEYRGVVPDLFKAGRDVVVEGQLDEDGVFQGDTLLTKCASKYETAGGEAPHHDPGAESK
jgi:cytochrome c-type biogenesis protein CcmE